MSELGLTAGEREKEREREREKSIVKYRIEDVECI